MTLDNLKHAFRKNSILLFATLGLMISGSLVVYYAEQNFANDKNQYIISFENRDRFFSDAYKLNSLLQSELMRLYSTESTPAISEIQSSFDNVVHQPGSIIYGLDLQFKSGEIIASSRDLLKLHQMNDFSNCLFKRKFTRSNNVSFDVSRDNKIVLIIHYTSPQHDEALQSMVQKYRWTVIPILLGLLLIYIASLRLFILPMRRVIDKMEGIKEKTVTGIRNPKTLLESAYNRMARNNNILNVNLRMNDLIANQPQLNAEQLLVEMLVHVQSIYPKAALLCLSKTSTQLEYRMLVSGDVSVRWEQIPLQSPMRTAFLDEIRDVFFFKVNSRQRAFIYLENIGNIQWYLTVPAEEQEWNKMVDDHKSLISLGQQMRLAVQSRELQRRYLEHEKSQVSIHLARNLGHDVTNILASIRWDMDTIDTILKERIGEINLPATSKTGQVVLESLESLTHGTELLQEIVEIYRSFMFLEKPVFETVDIEPVLARLLELFRRSTTQKINLKYHCATDVRGVNMDVRLFKLAIFNLLTNALEAIKAGSVDQAISGMIEVNIGLHAEKNAVEFRIRDNGPGICRPDGRLLSDEETDRIFRYGYTTKQKTAGGLGLAWVQTIICEIHKGTITAHNHPDGGAEFMIYLPRE